MTIRRCVMVPRSEAERVRTRLIDNGYLDPLFEIKSDGINVFLPLKDGVRVDYQIVEHEMKQRKP